MSEPSLSAIRQRASLWDLIVGDTRGGQDSAFPTGWTGAADVAADDLRTVAIEDHPARLVAVFVDAPWTKEGWAELGVEINGDPLGAPAYRSSGTALRCGCMASMTGVRSCGKLEAACRDQITYLWLTGWQQPDHNTSVPAVATKNRQAMRRLFKRTVRTAVAIQLVAWRFKRWTGRKWRPTPPWIEHTTPERGSDCWTGGESNRGPGGTERGRRGCPRRPLGPEELADNRALREQVRQAMDDLASQEGLRHLNLTDRMLAHEDTARQSCPATTSQSMVSPIEVDDEASGMLITALTW